MGKTMWPFALLLSFAVAGCGDDPPAEAPGTGASAGSGGTVGTGGTGGAGGTGGDAGTGGAGGIAGSAGAGGMGGAAGGGGSTVEVCTDDGRCAPEDDCVCVECDDDLFCRDPENCVTDGACNEFAEGCVCPDCSELPVCER